MARVVGVDLPAEKRVDIGLTTIFGVGRCNVMDVLRQALFEVKDCTSKSIGWLEYQSCIIGV